MGIIQPTKAELRRCEIAGLNYIVGNSNMFHVKEFRIYEDICKTYFTGQLVIETSMNTGELMIAPTVEVFIDFSCPRSDGGTTKRYQERFRIYSYESRPLSGGADARMEHTIQLIGQEYYNDKHNVVTQNFKNETGTSAARKIHNQYVQSNGGLDIRIPSTGLIGQDRTPHQTINKKPVKAVHDILDRVVYSSYKTCAPIYFRNKPGYVMGPLQESLERGPVGDSFVHKPIQGANIGDTLYGYNNIIHLRPLTPPGESSGVVAGMASTSSSIDLKNRKFSFKSGGLGSSGLKKFLNTSWIKNTVGDRGTAMLAEAMKGPLGGQNLFNVLDGWNQSPSVTKNGPGGYNQSQEAFLTALTYSQKYWISVPGQSGVNVTCGDRIYVTYPIGTQNPRLVSRTLFVPRLIHEVKFTEGPQRKTMIVNATTDLYCVLWQG